MINVTELRVQMARKNNMSDSELARKIGKSPATLGRWLKKGDMPITYAEKVIEALEIPSERAMEIFFAQFVA